MHGKRHDVFECIRNPTKRRFSVEPVQSGTRVRTSAWNMREEYQEADVPMVLGGRLFLLAEGQVWCSARLADVEATSGAGTSGTGAGTASTQKPNLCTKMLERYALNAA